MHTAFAFAALLCCLSAAKAQPGMKTLLAPGPWPAGLAGWERRGPAEFALDEGVTRQGRPTARVHIPPGTELQYQSLGYTVREDIRANDEFRAAAWVRTKDVPPDGSGAYVALETLDANGQRIGVFHNKLGPNNGRHGWERLWVEGRAAEGAVALRLVLVLHAEGTAWWSDPEIIRTVRPDPWPELRGKTRRVTIHADQTLQPRFRGVGFHAFHHIFDYTQEQLDEIVIKRWRELKPSFARLNDQQGWDRRRWESIARHVKYMQDTGTEIYIATWNPDVTAPGEARRAYARKAVDNLEYLVREKGLDNVRWYCMSNELTLGSWGSLADDLPTFRDYHQCLYDEIAARGLDIGLLATDAAPINYWWTLEWAVDNMDDITAIYGGHHYFAEHPPDDERFYEWFRGRLQWATDLARAKGKDFILGEFGCKQDGSVVDGVKRDVCLWWDTPQEPYVALQLADAVVAAINSGVYGLGYWTFMDLPDDYAQGYINKWGTFKWSGDDFSTRDHYYGYGLLSKFMRGPARAVRVECDDPRLHVAAIQQDRGGAWSIAVVNRNSAETPWRLSLLGAELAKPVRKYVYTVTSVPQHPFGDLQGPERTVAWQAGVLDDVLAPLSITVYTTAYDNTAPPTVAGVRATRREDGTVEIGWEPSRTPDLCYYRIFRNGVQIGSTVATHLIDRHPAPQSAYGVVAVDQSGNASPPSLSKEQQP